MNDFIEVPNIFNTILKIKKIKDLSSNHEGKNSTVFIGEDTQMNKMFLIKKVRKTKLFESGTDIFEEAKLLAKSTHRNIMPIQYASQDTDFLYMAIPYYKKGSLSNVVNDFESIQQLIAYCLDFLSGLTHAHIMSILHLDIKPSNIVIDDSDRAILTDFGQSHKLEDHEFVERSKAIYTLNFSPNIISSNTVSIEDDIHQVGITLYRLFNNFYYQESINEISGANSEFLGETILKKKFPKAKFMPHVPKRIERIIKKCLGRSSKRYNSVIDIMNDLAKIDDMLNVGYKLYDKNNSLEWHKYTSTAIININIDLKTNIVTATKTNIASGRTQKISKLNNLFDSQEKAFAAIRSQLEE